MENIKRISGVDLLRIIAICLIVIFHVNQTMGDFVNYDNYSISLIILHLFSYFGHIGNNIFIVSSSWFLYNTFSKVKPRKVINILLDSMSVSIIIFIIFCMTSSTVLPVRNTIEQFLPDVFQTVWFIPCYAIVYMIHPILNAGINSLNQNEHLVLCIISYLLYGIFGLFKLQPFYNYMIAFINIYILVVYIKKYLSDFCKNVKINMLLSIVFSIFLIIIILYGNHDILSFDHLYNVIITPLIICVFNVFNNMKFRSKLINYIASLSMLVYCIHENALLRTYVRPILCEKMLVAFGNKYVLIDICLSIVILIFSIILSIIYKKTIGILTNKISIKIEDIYYKFSDNACALSNRINDFFNKNNK